MLNRLIPLELEKMGRRAQKLLLSIGLAIAFAPAFAEDDLMLTCEVKAVRLCKENIEDHRCGPWRPPSGESVFGVSRTDNQWKRFGHWEVDLALIKDEDDVLNSSGYRFAYVRNGRKGLMAISRSSGEGMDVYQNTDDFEIAHSMIRCHKVENQW